MPSPKDENAERLDRIKASLDNPDREGTTYGMWVSLEDIRDLLAVAEAAKKYVDEDNTYYYGVMRLALAALDAEAA